MTKIEHDIKAAKDRTVDYNKPYFNKAIDYIKSNYSGGAIKILDIGAGNGEFAELAQKTLGVSTVCLDYADPHLERLRKLGFETHKIDFDKEDEVEEISNKFAQQFDIVTAFEIVEHIFGIDDFINFTHKVLKPGGIIVISTPNIDHFFYHLYALITGSPVGEGHHVRFFNKQRISQLLTVDGFDVVDNLSYGYGGAYYLWLYDKSQIRKIAIKAVGKILFNLIPKSSSKKYSKLMIVAKKVDVEPLGFDQTWRELRYNKLKSNEKEQILRRLIPYRKNGLFWNMPYFKKFIDSENNKFF